MADFKLDRIRFRWRGTWAISTSYVKDDIVLYQGKAYVCLVTHSSNAAFFYTDLEATPTKWELMLDGYVWRGDWTTSRYYTPGEIVKYDGYVYQCIEAHESTVVSSQGLPADSEKWILIATTYNWLNVWTAGTYYDLGDVIRYNGITYICNTKHRANTSAASGLEADLSKWTIVSRSDSWLEDWTLNTRYKKDDIVRYGGIVYRCLTGHTSANGLSQGLEADSEKWTIVLSGIEYKFDWTINTRYKLNDIVKWNHTLWICTDDHTSSSSNLRTDEPYWAVWLPGTGFENEWHSTIEYKKGDIVIYGGYAYTALQNNIGSTPSINGLAQDTGNWELLKQGYRHRGEWTNAESYKTGDVVRNSGYLYIAFADNSGTYPDLETHWTKLVTGSQWRAEWSDDTEYYLGDIVTYAGTAYSCIQRHISSASDSRPDIDLTQPDQDYWIVLIQGNENNVLTTQGDIRTHDGTTTVRQAIGTSGNLLKTISNAPTWQDFERINKVYFVSTTGVDDANNGKTLNAPFRTIKFAMEYILADEAARAPATVFVKTGLYEEILPIRIPANVALVGDELRSTTIQPAASYETSNMFYVRNGSGIRNCTLQGLYGTLGPAGIYGTSRPSAGAFVSLDPGSGPADTSTWITTKSPYVQNVTTFGTGCIGMKIDGALHNGGNRSIVANDFTQVLSDGIGYWAANRGRSELVSVFTYYCYIGYLSTDGGILRATNGNNSYGTYGSRAEGFDDTEIPITAEINNQTNEAQVEIVHTNGSSILAVGYSHAGQDYTSATLSFVGGGTSVSTEYNEFRNDAIAQVRVISPPDSTIKGGLNYQYLLNSAQSGDTTSITLAAADTTGTPAKYVGMRLFIDSGNGVGQYGVITGYDDVTKVAIISRESDGAAGWDHIYPGYPIEPVLDSTTRYKIEPRVIVNEPLVETTDVTGPSIANWNYIVYGEGKFVATTAGGSGAAYATYSSNEGATWSSPVSLGNDYLFSGLVHTGSKFLLARRSLSGAAVNTILQSDSGDTWSTVSLGSTEIWTGIAASKTGTVVLIGGGSQNVLFSANNGDSWTATTIPGSSESWGPAAYGSGKFVTLDTSTGAVAYSTDSGATWTVQSAALNSRVWKQVVYGNGRFVAISSTGNYTAYSFDGITWYESQIIQGTLDNISYGAGVFIATGTGDIIGKSQDGKVWRTYGDDSTTYTTTVTGDWKQSAYSNGQWVVVNDSSTSWNSIETGARAFIRTVVDASRIDSFIVYDPGSNYVSSPIITIIDPENTAEALTSIRRFDGVLSQPAFLNRGSGYVTATATVSGNGLADIYQLGNSIFVKNLDREPGPGDNLIINGITDVVYRIVAVDSITGVAPNYDATIRISPSIGNFESPEHEESIIIRQAYSQIRLTGHDFLDIGTGNKLSTSYPGLYVEGYESENEPQQENEVSEAAGGRVFYTSTDQDGNFRVGELFRVEQSTGIVSISADFFELDGLTEISLGGIQVGGSAVVIREFSKESTFVANSNNVVPTQKAIKTYLESRISSGGSDAVTNTLIAGRVRLTGSSISTTSGEEVLIPVAVNQTGGISGDYLAMQYYNFGSRVPTE